MPSYTFTLPVAPSANRYWRNVKGRMVVSEIARAYKREAAYEALRQGVRPLAGGVSVWLDIYRARRVGDTDNFLKVALDALKGVGFADDSQVVEIHARRFDDAKNPRIEVRLEAGA